MGKARFRRSVVTAERKKLENPRCGFSPDKILICFIITRTRRLRPRARVRRGGKRPFPQYTRSQVYRLAQLRSSAFSVQPARKRRTQNDCGRTRRLRPGDSYVLYISAGPGALITGYDQSHSSSVFIHSIHSPKCGHSLHIVSSPISSATVAPSVGFWYPG